MESKTPQALAAPAIAWLFGKDVNDDERNELTHVIQQELRALHESTIASYEVSLDDFNQWKSGWQGQQEDSS